MATKFHIKDDGTPGQCGAASAESCPKTQAGDGFHGTLAEASAESERRFEASHGSVPVSSSPASSSPVEDRRAFSTDMMDSSEYRVEGGRLKVEFEGDGYDLGELKAVSSEEIKSWSQDTFGSELELQDGEVFPLYDEEGSEAGAYMRSGDGFYRAGAKGAYQMDPPSPSSDSASYRRLALEADYAAKSVALQAARDAEAKLVAEQKAYDEANGVKEGRARHKIRVVGSTSTKTAKGRNPKNGPTYYIPTKGQIDSRLDAKARIDTADREATAAFVAVESKASTATGLSLSEQAQDLRDSVRDYRDTRTSEVERESIQDYWASQGVSSQFAALNRAANIQNEAQRRKVAKGATPSSAHEGDPKPKLPPFEQRVEREAVDQISTLGGNYSVKERAELKRSLKARLEVSGDLSADAVRLATRKTVDEFDRSQPGWNSKGRG